MTSTGVEAVALSCTAPGTTSLRTLRLPTGGGALQRERDRARVAGKKVDRAGGGPPRGGGAAAAEGRRRLPGLCPASGWDAGCPCAWSCCLHVLLLCCLRVRERRSFLYLSAKSYGGLCYFSVTALLPGKSS